MTGTSSLHKKLRPVRIGPLTIHWLRHLLPLIMVGLAVHLLLPHPTAIHYPVPGFLSQLEARVCHRFQQNIGQMRVW